MGRVRRRLSLTIAAVGVISACSSAGSEPAASPPPTPDDVAASATPAAAPAHRLRATVAGWRLPAPRSREVAVHDGDSLLVAGGLSAAHVSTSTVWAMDPATGRVGR